MYKPRKTTVQHTYLKAETSLTYQKNFANFCNVVSQNLAAMTAKFDKKFAIFRGVQLEVLHLSILSSVTSKLCTFLNHPSLLNRFLSA